MVTQPESGVEFSSYLRVHSDAEFQAQINGDGDFEMTFDRVATLALTADAAEEFHRMLGDELPELRQRAAVRLG